MALDMELELEDDYGPRAGAAGSSKDIQMHFEGVGSATLDLELEADFAPTTSKLATARPAWNVHHLNLGDDVVSRSLPVNGKTFDGKNIVFGRKRPKPAHAARQAETQSKALAQLAMSMLEQPLHRMLDAIGTEDAAGDTIVLAYGITLIDSMAGSVAHSEVHSAPVQPNADVKGKGKAGTATTMWTDRYKPRHYTDLLGDDRVNRAAMNWLKEWDQCVFKTSLGGAAQARKKALAKKRMWNEDLPENVPDDPYGRPTEKVLLFSGPPGLGKTTLAHVLAKQAGYQVLEINASDDRTAKVVHERIQAALESRAIMSNGATSDRPTCVVIDEIDGATGGGDAGFIKTLVRLIQDGSATRKPKGKKKEHRPLLRPIICVCNDLYAPALRPLRPLARVIRFSAPTNNMVVRRLSDICNREHLKADAKSLNLLVEVAKGDMRSCLNTLQFIQSKSASIDEASMRSTVVNLKDTGSSPASVWEKLFKEYYNRKGAKQVGDDGTYVARMARDVQTCGEYDKLAQGCFENYLSVKQPTNGWKSIVKMLDWVAFYDRLEARMKAEHTFDLLAYTPYSFVPWHALYKSHGVKPFDWPKVDYENYLRRQAHQEIADTLAKGAPSTLARLFHATEVATELAPFMVRILSPDLRPVNAQLIKTEERTVMLKLVRIMSACECAFVHEKGEDGQLSYRLEPALDVFVHYDGKRASDIAPGRYSLRSIVAKELEKEASGAIDSGEGASATSAQDYMSAYKHATKGQSTEAPPREPAAAVDFFGRAVAVVPGPEKTGKDLEERPRKRVCISYKHHEGFSNAVRLNIKINQLFRT